MEERTETPNAASTRESGSFVMCKTPKMKKAVAYLTNYMVTYDKQIGYLDYNARTYIDDILYGLGVSLNSEEFSGADGFMRFKKELKQYLNT